MAEIVIARFFLTPKISKVCACNGVICCTAAAFHAGLRIAMPILFSPTATRCANDPVPLSKVLTVASPDMYARTVQEQTLRIMS
jgi:hypothetical protein